MSYRLAAGYLAYPASNGAVSFELWWDGANNFSLHATGSGVLLNYSRLSRVDFFDRDGTTALAVIPCAADSSNVSFDHNGSCIFALHLRSLLGGGEAPATFVLRPVQIDQALNPTYDLCFDAQAPGLNIVAGIRLGNEAVFAPDQTQSEDDLLKRYVGNLQALRKVGDHPQFKVQGAAVSSFETISDQPFGSDHVTYSLRPVPSGETSVRRIPVLALRRGYTATSSDVVVSANRAVATLFPGPFDLPIFTTGTDSGYHVVQFPSIDWLNETQGVGPLPEPAVWHFETGEFPPDQIQQFWQSRVQEPYVGGLRIINAPLPVSTVPALNWDAVQNYDASWRVVRTAAIGADGATLTLLLERLLPGGYLTAENGDPTKALPVACALPAFRGHDGVALKFNALLEPWTNFDMESERETKPGLAVLHSMQFQLMLTAPVDVQPVRLGSLDLTLSGGFPEDLDPATFPHPSVRIDFERSALDGRWIPRVYVTGSLPVTRYGPGSEDEPLRDNEFRITPAPGSQEAAPSYARSNPIVIDAQLVRNARATAAGTPLPADDTAFALTFSELTLPSPQQQQLVLALSEIGKTATAPPGVLVLDREPFTVAYVTLGDAADSDDSDNTLVGVWCNLYPEGPGWRLRAGAGGFNLYLPPQAVGEAMVKDFTYDGSKTTDYRFSPLLKARLLATYFAQNAVQPGWDLRRILGNSGQQLPGALVDDKNGGISFELLHGMTASVTHPALRLSEMFARLGDFPGPLPALDGAGPIDSQYSYQQVTSYNNAANAWANLYSQLLSRLGVFELWDDQQGPDLLLDEGVQYTIRKDALYTDDPPRLTPPIGVPPPPQLKGGIGYAVDSPNIQTELLGNLASTAGRLVSPRFTALGGYGTQRAEFANGKVIVDSRTTMGRLESMTVTLVGRIGTMYNHALHVTVYERTTLPSDQFALEQDRFAGIPLLRKVSEYVLLTEDTRAYPEDASSDAALAGFVTASHFKSTRINVDSVWGGDVGDIGWQVPLWQEDAVPATVYPKPHVALKVAVDPAVGVDGVQGEIDDPQKLCFYTDTRSNTTSDTDSWPVIPGIDWIDQPESPDGGDGADFQDPSVEPGFGNFTYHFVESPAQVNIVAARAKTAVGATLSNVSMMRGPRLTEATAPSDATALRQQAARRLVDWWTATHAHLKQAADTAAQTIAAAGNTAGAQALAVQRLKDSIQSVQDTYLNSTSGLGKELGALGGAAGAACDAVKARLHSAMNRMNGEQQTVVSTILQQFPAQVLSRLNATPAAAQSDFVEAVNDQVGQMTVAAQKTLVPVIGDVGTVRSTIANYKAALDDYAKAIGNLSTAITNAAGKATDELKAAATAVAPGSNLRNELDSAAVAVSQASRYILGTKGTGVVASIDGAIDVALTQLSGALYQTGADISGFVGLVQTAISKLTPILTTADAACASAINSLGNLQPSKLQTFFSTLGTDLSTAIQEPGIQTIADVRAAYTSFLQSVTTPVGSALSRVEQAISDQEAWIDNQASTLCQTLSPDVTALLGQLSDLAKDELTSILQNYAGDLGAFESALQTMGDQVESQLKQVTAAVAEEARTVVSGVAGAALQVIRAFGEPPHVPNMGFQVPMDVPVLDLPSMAYRFTNALPAVDLTPARAIASQIAQGLSLPDVGGLSQMGVHLPTTQLLDRLVPASLENFDLRDILPKFAGIDLSTLFAGVRMPSVANDTVRITHHVDPQTKRASLDADIHVPLASETTILDFGPVTLLLEDAEFTAHVHCEVTVGQQIAQTSSGEITGDWQLLIGGMEILAFTQTTLSFDSSGAMHFAITPANVRLSEVLQFLADIVNSFTFGDSGFSIHATVDPLAVQCILNLPLPDMSAGAFGIQNLHFGALFEVGIDANGFYLGVGANLARKTLPFILTVFVLGGAGWMEGYLRYQNGKATGEITIGMAAAASIAISLGPISGSVSIDFGIFLEFSIGGGGGLQLGIMILIVGRVSLCGIIDANITLLLEAQYSSGGGLVGRGYVSVTIKICWCFTLNVHSSVSFTFGASKQSQPPAHPAAMQLPAGNAAARLPDVAAAAPMAAAGVVAAPIARPTQAPGSRTIPAAPTPAPPVPAPIDQYKQAALDYVDMLA